MWGWGRPGWVAGRGIYCRYSTLELAYRLFKLADHLDRERQLAEAVGQLRDQPAWSPEVHRQAWHAAANAVAIGRRVWVDSSPDGLRMGISPAEEDGPDFSLPLRAGIDAAGFRRTPPDLRPMVAELTAIDAVMPHDPHAQWPETVAARREELLVRLWRTAHGSAWWRWDVPAPVAGYDRDHSDPHRPLVLVVQLPDGPQIRGHVAADAVDEWELADAAVMPWDGAAREGSYRQRVEWLTS